MHVTTCHYSEDHAKNAIWISLMSFVRKQLRKATSSPFLLDPEQWLFFLSLNLETAQRGEGFQWLPAEAHGTPLSPTTCSLPSLSPFASPPAARARPRRCNLLLIRVLQESVPPSKGP
eukprot:scaffold280346_cov31-Tisochrysis_lutea.AAC.1